MVSQSDSEENSPLPWQADLESSLGNEAEGNTDTESEGSLILTTYLPKDVHNVDDTPPNDVPLTIRPFPLGSPQRISSARLVPNFLNSAPRSIMPLLPTL